MKPLSNDDMGNFWVWMGLLLFSALCCLWCGAVLTKIDWTTLSIYVIIRSII